MGDSTVVEDVLAFTCEQAALLGILSRPPSSVASSSIAVVIVVGGPQYRVGSHRQFVLLARRLALNGYPTLRFDCRGMGDSEGDMQAFEATGPDLRAAIDALCEACPPTQHIVVWGLCDAASAAMMFATADERVVGIVAANPWARSDASLAATQVKHYYGARLMQGEFWLKLLRGRLDWRASLRSLIGKLSDAFMPHRRVGGESGAPAPDNSFQTRMAKGLAGFRGRMLLILSGNDLTAKEFLQYTGSAGAWKGLLDDPRVHRVEVPEADHTFSSRTWLNRAEEETLAWLQGLAGAARRATNTSEGV